MKILDIQIEGEKVEITFCKEGAEDVITISKRDAELITNTILKDRVKECHAYVYSKIENFADQKYKGLKHRSTNYNTVSLGAVVSVINYLSLNSEELVNKDKDE